MHLKDSLIITMIRVLPEGIWQKLLLFASSKQMYFCSYFSFSLFNFSSFILVLPSYWTKEEKCQFVLSYFLISGLLSSVKIGLYESRSSSFRNSLTTVGVYNVLYPLLITWLNNILLTKFLKKLPVTLTNDIFCISLSIINDAKNVYQTSKNWKI